jgi:hypothetical protein
MNCLDCHPDEAPSVDVYPHCGAGLCAEHVIESEEYLTFLMPINRPVPVAPPTRKLRCARCAAEGPDTGTGDGPKENQGADHPPPSSR